MSVAIDDDVVAQLRAIDVSASAWAADLFSALTGVPVDPLVIGVMC